MLALFIISLFKSSKITREDPFYKICYKCDSFSYGYDLLIDSDEDIAKLASIIPPGRQSVSFTWEEYPETVLDLSKDNYSTKQIELIGNGRDYYNSNSMKISFGAVQTLILNNLQFSIIENSKTDHIGKLISTDSYIISGQINYELVDELDISVSDFNYFGPKTGFQKNINILANKDSCEVKYYNDSWTIESYSYSYGRDKITIKYNEFLYINLIVSTARITLIQCNIIVLLLPINVLSRTIKIYIGSGWECAGLQMVAFANTVYSVVSKSFLHPFTIPVDKLEVVTTENIDIQVCDIILSNYKVILSYDPWGHDEFKVSGNKITFKGINVIENGYGFTGLFFQSFTLFSNSSVNLPFTFLNDKLLVRKGSRLTMNGKLSANKISVSFSDDNFPLIDMNNNEIEASSIKIVYSGKAKDSYDILNGRKFDIIKSSKCEELKSKSTFVSKIPEFNGTSSILSLSCNQHGTLQVIGPAFPANNLKEEVGLKSKIIATISDNKTPAIVGISAAISSIIILLIAFIIKSI